MTDAADNAEFVTLTYPGGTADFPIVRGADGHDSVDISTFTKQTGLTTLDHGFVNTASTRSSITYIDGERGILRYRGYAIEDVAQNSTYLEVAWLLIHGELPTPDRARRVRRAHPPAHPAARGPSALLRRAAAQRAPDVGALERGLGALDLLPGLAERARPRAGRDLDHPPAREAAGHRRVRAQEVARPGVPVPGQLPELRRQLPQAELRHDGRALRGRPGALEGPRPPADPARGPRAERIHVDRSPGRLDRREHLRVDLRRHQRALRPPARRRERGRAHDAR